MSETQRDIPTFNSVAAEIGELVTAKNAAYGDSFAKCGEFLRLLYPDGLEPAKYGDALSMVRIFDKQMRIATRKDAFGESPYNDIAGYAILGATADAKLAQFHTPLSPSEVKEIAESVAPPVLCDTCVREKCPPDQRGGIATECAGYLSPSPPPSDEWETKDLCRRCGNGGKNRFKCPVPGGPDKMEVCPDFTPKEAPAPLSLSLPSITVEGDLDEVRKKYEEEVEEWHSAETLSLAEMIEALDVVQVRQTYLERGGDVAHLDDTVLAWMKFRHEKDPNMVEAAKRAMIIKNAARAMYAPEVCAEIIMSGGTRW